MSALSKLGRWWRIAIAVAVLLTLHEMAFGSGDSDAPAVVVETPGAIVDSPVQLPVVDAMTALMPMP